MAGAGVYTYQLARALAEAAGKHRLVIFARPGVLDDVASKNVRVVHVGVGSRALRLLWEQTVLPLLLRRLRIDVLHSPHHHTPLAARLHVGGLAKRTRLVVTVHDVTFMLIPQRYHVARLLYMEAVTRSATRVADAIVTPSQTVRQDVIRVLRVAPERIVAIPEAAGAQYVPVDDEDALGRVRWKYQLPTRYILSVGSLEPGKNRARLFRAYADLRDENAAPPIVVAGQPAWRYQDDFDLVERLGLEDRVRFLGYVPDEDMPALYSGATCFAFPSLYEGFGLPVLEAMACGAPVLTSNVSATAEVAGDAALLVDPHDTLAITAALDRLLSDAELRAELRSKGLDRARQFSWQRAARQAMIVYEIVASRD
ncbi:MAG: glycosyltransferase family 1 protein [Dehalococcoidia bacterium]